MMWVFWAVLGATLGSVSNALVYRLPRNKSWVAGRSICPQCQHELGTLDLIPLLSYVFLGGKCRYCRKPIGMNYFWVELAMAVSFAYLQNIFLAGLAFVSITVAVMDWQTQLVSDWLVGSWLISTLIFMNYELITMNLLGALIAVIVIGAIWAISKGRAMGFGDVEIAALLGLWLGWPKILVGLWMAFVLGGVIALIALISKTKKMKSQIAFGPFLILGAWGAYFFGATILKWVGIPF